MNTTTGPDLPPDFAQSMGTAIGVGIAGCFVFLAGFAVLIWAIWMMYTALSRVSPRVARIEPGLVWLLVIPIFNYAWIWFVAIRGPRSITAAGGSGDGGAASGIACAVAWAVQLLVSVGIAAWSFVDTMMQMDFGGTGPGTVPVASPAAQIVQAIAQWACFIVATVLQVRFARAMLRSSEAIPAASVAPAPSGAAPPIA